MMNPGANPRITQNRVVLGVIIMNTAGWKSTTKFAIFPRGEGGPAEGDSPDAGH